MRRRKDARQLAAVLDKAREISREEPSADWSEAEWKTLMAAAVAQKIEGREERTESKLKAVFWKPALAYGGAALIMMAIIGYTLRNSFFRPSVAPALRDQAVAQKSVAPPAPALETVPSELPTVVARAKDAIAAKPVPAVIQPRKTALSGERARDADAAGIAPSQDEVTVKLVSPETGLQIVWVLNKNFEWKGENP